MKKHLTIVALASTLMAAIASPAMAVQTKDCPQSLDVRIESISTLTESEIFKKARFSFSGSKKGDFSNRLGEIRSDLKQLDKVPRSANLTLRTKKSGVCTYQDNHIVGEIYTRSGSDLLRLHLSFNGSAWLNISSMSPNAIKFVEMGNRPVSGSYGEIGDEGRGGDQFFAILAFANFVVR